MCERDLAVLVLEHIREGALEHAGEAAGEARCMLAERRAEMTARGAKAWKPVGRKRDVSPALRAYAAMTTNAARGAVRDVSQVEHG